MFPMARTRTGARIVRARDRQPRRSDHEAAAPEAAEGEREEGNSVGDEVHCYGFERPAPPAAAPDEKSVGKQCQSGAGEPVAGEAATAPAIARSKLAVRGLRNTRQKSSERRSSGISATISGT